MKLTKNQSDRIEKSLEKFKTVVNIDTVIPYDKNPRNNDEAVSGVAASLRDFGWKDGAAHKWYGDRKQSTVISVPDCPFILREDGKYQLKVGNRIYSIASDAVCIEEVTTVVECPKPKRNDIHPTMKPVELLIKLLKHSCKRGDIIVDPFGGSGSTLIAAEQTGRTAFLMELDERYVDAIRKLYAEFRYGEGCAWEKLTPAEQ